MFLDSVVSAWALTTYQTTNTGFHQEVFVWGGRGSGNFMIMCIVFTQILKYIHTTSLSLSLSSFPLFSFFALSLFLWGWRVGGWGGGGRCGTKINCACCSLKRATTTTVAKDLLVVLISHGLNGGVG